METIREFKEKNGNKTLKVFLDENAENPREWDNFGKMVLTHKKYIFPNEIDLNFDSFTDLNEIEEHLKKEFNAEVILLINLYDHSGISISASSEYPFNCRWDSSQIGFIFCSKEDLKEEGITKDKAKKILESEVKTYSQYLEGDVYGFSVVENVKVKIKKEYENGEKETINTTEEQEKDSCWEFFGSDEETIKDMFDHAGLNYKDFEEI